MEQKVFQCKNPDCSKPVIRTEAQIKKGSKLYCSRECAGLAARKNAVEYTEEQKQYLAVHSHTTVRMVGTGAFAHPDRIYTTRKVAPGKIKVRFKKNNTEISANDADHVDRIIKQYSESLGEVKEIVDPENILGKNEEAVDMSLI